jgi:hypothetical protein
MGEARPPLGAHIRVRRWVPGPYWHHGVYVGDGWVVHLTGGAVRKLLGIETPRVRKTALDEFCDGGEWKYVNHKNPCTPEKAVRRAEDSVGYEHYNLLKDNCEHFATWCVTNDARSRQAFGLARKEAGKGYRW